MRLKDAIFWFGIAVFSAGPFFVVEPDKRTAGIVFMLVGMAMGGYSVYHHYHPNLPKSIPAVQIRG